MYHQKSVVLLPAQTAAQVTLSKQDTAHTDARAIDQQVSHWKTKVRMQQSHTIERVLCFFNRPTNYCFFQHDILKTGHGQLSARRTHAAAKTDVRMCLFRTKNHNSHSPA